MLVEHTSRLHTVRERRERLVEANHRDQYLHNGKADRYLKTLKTMREEIVSIEMNNRKLNKDSSLRQFLNASKGMSGFQILTASR